MKTKSLLPLLAGISLLLLPALAKAAMPEVTGVIEGLNCVQKQATCPVDNMDPHLAYESGFVVMQEGGGNLLITGVDKSVLARHVHDKVKIMGKVDDKYNTVKASSIMVMKGSKWTETWSRKAEEEERSREMVP